MTTKDKALRSVGACCEIGHSDTYSDARLAGLNKSDMYICMYVYVLYCGVIACFLFLEIPNSWC